MNLKELSKDLSVMKEKYVKRDKSEFFIKMCGSNPKDSQAAQQCQKVREIGNKMFKAENRFCGTNYIWFGDIKRTKKYIEYHQTDKLAQLLEKVITDVEKSGKPLTIGRNQLTPDVIELLTFLVSEDLF